MKKFKILLISMFVLLLLQAPAVVRAAEQKNETESTTTVVNKVVNKGLTKKNGDYYYYKNGKKLTSVWKTINGKRYYFKKNGKAATGVTKINKKIYLFNLKGHLMKRKAPVIVTVSGKNYCVSASGTVYTGWQIIGGKLYYFSKKTAVMLKNRVVDNIPLTKKGHAKTTATQTKLKKKTMQLVKSITNSSMSRSQKLSACYQYMASRSRFSYRTWRAYQYYENWEMDYAYEILTKYAGNCYNFAAGFAYLAKEVGYEVYVIRGRIPGSRDGAGDGLTRHSWVMIQGLHYDPEGAFAGFVNAYGVSAYPMRHQITASHKI